MAEIELRRVTKRFHDSEAVREASFTIHDGEFFILVGPSGCGKSTLLNMIVGLEEITEGEIRLDGVRINDVDPKDRNMAMVFQSYALYPHLSVRENMAFPLKLAKLPRAEIDRRVAQAAEILELAEFLARKPVVLSGGQRQRVAMGRAIVREPKVFLLDEPLSNLDAKLRGQMRTEIARLQRRLGTTTIYVTHDQTEAMTLGDRIAVLRRGEVQQIGTPQELYMQPRNLFVAGFIGSPAMNFLPARMRDNCLELPIGSFELSEPMRRRLKTAPGPLAAGFRPDHLQVVPNDSRLEGGLHIRAKAEVVEWLGADLFIHSDVTLGEFQEIALPEELGLAPEKQHRRTLVARVDPATRVREGDTMSMRLDPRHVLVFDAVSGENMSLELTH